jgi:hypothetical protein
MLLVRNKENGVASGNIVTFNVSRRQALCSECESLAILVAAMGVGALTYSYGVSWSVSLPKIREFAETLLSYKAIFGACLVGSLVGCAISSGKRLVCDGNGFSVAGWARKGSTVPWQEIKSIQVTVTRTGFVDRVAVALDNHRQLDLEGYTDMAQIKQIFTEHARPGVPVKVKQPMLAAGSARMFVARLAGSVATVLIIVLIIGWLLNSF